MTTPHDKKMLDREAVRSVIQQWNANRIDLFALSEPDENLLFHGVMRFYFQDAGQKVATKCIRVASDATVSDVIDTLIEKFRPDMRMLSVPNYALYEVHANGEERRLNPDEKPLLVQLNWHIDDREGRFLLKNIDQKSNTLENSDNNFKRKLSKREKKEQKKKEKLAKLNSDAGGCGNNGGGNGISGNNNNDGENHVAEKLYSELPETSFTRSISNPEAVMRRRRQQKLEKKLQQFRSKDGGPDTGGTLKIYGESLCRDVPYKTLLLSIRDCAQAVVREMLSKYGLEKADPLHYCLVQVNSDGTEYILDDDECPLSILMNHPTSRGSIMFHVRRRPADSQPRRRKKKPLGVSNGSGNSGTSNLSGERDGPMLVEVTHSGDGGRRIKLGPDAVEVGSANSNLLQLYGPSIQPRHCIITYSDGICTVTPLQSDALTFVNGHHITQPTVLHNGSVVMFGRVASYRFVDSPSDGRYNLALSQSQLDSACLYESRSPTSPSWNDDDRALSPVSSLATNTTATAQTSQQQHNLAPTSSINNNNNNTIKQLSYLDSCDSVSQQNMRTDFDKIHHTNSGGSSGSSGGNGGTNNNISGGGLINDDQIPSGQNSTSSSSLRQHPSHQQQQSQQLQETDFAYDPDGNGNTLENETKSISSYKSGGSNQDSTRKLHGAGNEIQGQEPILPAVLEFPETHQEAFLRHVISELDVNVPNFKLAPVYTLYLCARYRASTHYRPELQPTERAHKLTIFLHHVANLIYSVIQENYTDPRILAFWMANSSEFLNFLKSDRHISAFSVQAQEVLAECVQTAFRNLVNCFRVELSQTLNQFLSENIDHDSAAGLVLTVLGSAMALLRRCRVNAALTIQLFSQLFHYINVICFNTIVTNSHMCTAEWGKVMLERLSVLEQWAERQGLELAADCHLAKINQCAQFLQAPKTSVEEVQKLACSCFRLNSLQMAALLQQEAIPRNLVDAAVRMAESVADELTRADGREVRLEESPELHLALLLPDDGFSCDVVRGIPSGLVDFLSPLQAAGMCRLAAQPTSIGLWTVYMHQFNTRSSSSMSNKLPQPEIQVIKLHKNSNGMGLSIVAAKGAGQERLGIYIKSVVPGGAADADGRLQAGDQLLRVDGQSLIGITQERAADYLVRTGPVVTLEVAKQGAIYHGLAALLQQPSPIIQRGNRRTSDRDMNRMGGLDSKTANQSLANSKSVPALHHAGSSGMSGPKSRSIHSLVNNSNAGNSNEQGFYQNLSVYRAQNQSQPTLGDRSQVLSQTTINSIGTGNTITSTNPSVTNRPVSAYYNSNNNPTTSAMHSPNSYLMQSSAAGNNGNLMNGGIASSVSTSHLHHHHHHHQQQQSQQQQQPFTSSLINQRPVKNFARESQSQHSLRMNQMMAPSMPNIAHSSGYASNMSASQSMQNVNMITGQHDMHAQHTYPNGGGMHLNHQQIPGHSTGNELMHGHQRIHDPRAAAQLRGQAKLAEMGEFVTRRNQRQELGYDGQSISGGGPFLHSNQQQQQQHSTLGSISKQNIPMHSPNTQMSPVKQLPPTAPKPHGSRTQLSYSHAHQSHEESTPPLPPTTTHPLFKPTSHPANINYVASTLDPPKAAYYPVASSSIQHPKNFVPGNPWEREEREKENELRREHIRHWRDQQIAELSALTQRTPQQEEQLKTLVLERDFERRALEVEDQEDDSETAYSKDNVHEVIRLTMNPNTIQAPTTNFRQVDHRIAVTTTTAATQNTNAASEDIPPPVMATTSTTNTTATTMANDSVQSYQSYSTQQNQSISTTVQPKSILKHNRYDTVASNTMPSSPSKSQKSASFADDHRMQSMTGGTTITTSATSTIMTSEHSISQISKDINNISISSEQSDKFTENNIKESSPELPPTNMIVPPPPPPERNSSYLVMSQQQQKFRNSNSMLKTTLPPPEPSIITSPISSYVSTSKRSTAAITTNNNNNIGNFNNNNNNNIIGSTSLSQHSPNTQLSNSLMNNSIGSHMTPPTYLRDGKRVSFHDEENNCLPPPEFLTENSDLETVQEDPNRFIQETTAILQTPTTPETEQWNNTVQSTPGVIGAQEVYRDPRQKRLQEQQQKQQQKSTDAVPEKLSFKEKMKMFALESGENQTPKDKLKISRAQRDIDAVH